MPRRGPEEPIRAGTADMLMSRSSAVRKRLGNLEKVSIEYIEASGDCFYLAIESALSEEEGWCPYFAVSTMREVVASKMTEETYQMYALMYQQQAEGFGFMQGIDDVDILNNNLGCNCLSTSTVGHQMASECWSGKPSDLPHSPVRDVWPAKAIS